jgi:DNA-binding beta-propeller fold protein YncE
VKINGSGAPSIDMLATETGNSSAPGGTATDSSLSINIQSGITVTPVLTNPWPLAVQGRSYGQLGTTADFDATGGISPYVSYTPTSSFPSGFSCTLFGVNGITGQCSATTVGAAGSYTPQVTVVDTGDASTPAATTLTDLGSTSPNATSLTVNPPITINAITLPNGLVNYPYPNPAVSPLVSTFSATGGLGNGTYAWTAPPSTGACTPTGILPTGIALNGSSGVLSGTPTGPSLNDSQFVFEVCATDTANTFTPAGSTTSGDSMAVINTLAFVADTNLGKIDVINTTTNTTVGTITLASGDQPYNVAISPSGAVAYVTIVNDDELFAIDTITDVASSPIALETGCIPHGVAATNTAIFVACHGLGDIDVVDASSLTLTATIASDHTTSAPEGVAVRADGNRVYVTLSAENELLVIDSSSATPVALGSPFTLATGDGETPFDIALVPVSGATLAYISKRQGGDTMDGVEVVSINSSNDSLSTVGNFQISAGSAFPTGVAVTPDNSLVYVTLAGDAELQLFSTTPAAVGSPVDISSAGHGPFSVAIPPLATVPSTGVFVYVPLLNNGLVALIDNNAPGTTPPAVDSTTPTIALFGGAQPQAIASIPIPQ